MSPSSESKDLFSGFSATAEERSMWDVNMTEMTCNGPNKEINKSHDSKSVMKVYICNWLPNALFRAGKFFLL